jgi:hypothetical protein
MLTPEEIDRRLNWPPGRAERLARQRRLPHLILPDGRIRFVWEQIERLVIPIPLAALPHPPQTNDGGRSDE